MTKRSTKSALLSAVLALVICFTALVGTTFAWFTDSVTSANNKIVAGNLDVDLFLWTAADESGRNEITESSAPIFGEGQIAQDNAAETLWEPGKTQVAYLSIKNNGSLDLKYTVVIEVYDVEENLIEALEYDIIEDAKYDEVTEWANDGTAVLEGVNATQAIDVPLTAGAEHFFALSVHMLEEAGNEFQNGSVTFDIKVLATQLASEEDSFGKDYDKDATYPATEQVTIPAGTTEPTKIVSGEVAVEVPAGAEEGVYTLNVSNKEVTETTEGTTVAFDIELTKNGEKAPAGTYTVSINVGKNLNIAAVTHKGEAVTDYDYDLTTGVITFTTTNFSPFAVTYTNAEVAGVEDLVAMLEAGKNAALTADVDMSKAAVKNKAIVIPENSNVTLDLNGHTLTSKDGGGKNTMAIRVERGATLTIEDTVGGGEIVASCYGIYVQPNAKLVMNGGKLTVHGNNTYDMAVVLWNAEFVMNAGEIDANYGVYASNYWKENGEPDAMTCKVTINDAKSTITAKTAAIGTAEAPDTVVTKIVSTADELVGALENKYNVKFANDIEIDPANMSNAYGATGINVLYGQTIDGNGYTLDIKGAGGTWDSGINTTGGLIKNITVTGSFRGIFINHTSTYSETVVLENVTTTGTVYTISCDQGMNQFLKATNCTFNGWTSFAATLGTAEFVNCTFAEGSGYAYCRPYADTTFTGCEFEAGFELDPAAKVVFDNCKLDNTVITAENMADLVKPYVGKMENASVK